MISKLKRPPTQWEKIFPSCISDKGLKTRIYMESEKLNSPKINELIRAFSKEEIQMAKKTHEKILTIPGHKGNANQNHTKMSPYSC
jgi:hypothetical protein